jgi:hypothetical protein
VQADNRKPLVHFSKQISENQLMETIQVLTSSFWQKTGKNG